MFIIFTSSACLSLDMFDLYSDIMDIYTMKSLFIKKPNFQHLSSITNVNIVINFERYWWINTVLYDHLIYVTKLLEITQNLSQLLKNTAKTNSVDDKLKVFISSLNKRANVYQESAWLGTGVGASRYT